jgi:ABC-type transport system involved in multi-copper enzyme maturation permease subunit
MTWEQIQNQPWDLWVEQARAVVRLEWKKSFWGKRAIWLYFLALAPVLLSLAAWLVSLKFGKTMTVATATTAFAATYHVYFLRLAIFFGCLGIFGGLFRMEVLERTLHYYLLAPVRREVLVVSKYLSGLFAAVVFFGISVALTFLTTMITLGPEMQKFLGQGGGIRQLLAYEGVTALACAGYGALFLLFGFLFKNPMLPAAVVLVWEGLNPLLPELLKKISVIFYLKSLTPVDLPMEGPFPLLAVVADPAPAWLAVPGVLLVAALILTYAASKARKMEVSYSSE